MASRGHDNDCERERWVLGLIMSTCVLLDAACAIMLAHIGLSEAAWLTEAVHRQALFYGLLLLILSMALVSWACAVSLGGISRWGYQLYMAAIGSTCWGGTIYVICFGDTLQDPRTNPQALVTIWFIMRLVHSFWALVVAHLRGLPP